MRIVYFAVPYAGHINPNIPLFKELQKRKEELVIFGDQEYISWFIGNDYVKYIELPDYVKEYWKVSVLTEIQKVNYAEQYFSFIYDENLLKEKAYQENTLQNRFYKEYMPILEMLEPDCVIYDSYAFYMNKIIGYNKIKFLEINCAITVPDDYFNSSCWAEYIQNIVSKEVENAPDIEKMRLIKKRMKRFHRRFLDEEATEKVEPYFFCYHSDLLQYQDDDSRVNPIYIGYDIEIQSKIKKDGSIFVSRGTMSDVYGIMMLKNTLDSLNGMDYKVYTSLGKNEKAIQLLNNQTYKENIQIFSFVNQIEYLSKASIFITHGGISGVRESILCKTPMIVCPANYLDYMVGKALEKAGAGILLDSRPLNSKDIIDAVNYMNEKIDKFNIGIERIATQLKETWDNAGIYRIINIINS